MYKIFYKTFTGLFRVYDGVSLSTENFMPIKCNAFYLPKKYTANDASLIQYYTDIKIASEELKASYELNGYDYLKETPFKTGNEYFYNTHQSNIISIFRIKASKKLNWKNWKPIHIIEAKWFKWSSNGALQYCKPGEYQAYGYDFNMYYPRLLGDKKKFSQLQIPTNEGKEYILKDLTTIQYGFYRVKLICNDPNILKIFSFSKHNVYTHYSLNFIYELIRNHNFKIDIELIQDGEPNAYLYKDEDLIASNSLFDNWFKCLSNLKKKYPKNILIKMLCSSIWGHLSQKNIVTVSDDKIDNYNVDIGDDADYKILDHIYKEDGTSYWKLLNTKQPYKLPLRIKPFLTSYGRNKTARVALRMIENVIRIHTDGIVFDKEYNFKSEHLLKDNKYTGHILFKNINNYINLNVNI